MHVIAQSFDGQYVLEGEVANDADFDGVFTLRETQPPHETLRVNGWLFEIEIIPPDTKEKEP